MDEFLLADKELEELRRLKKDSAREMSEVTEGKVAEPSELIDEIEGLLGRRDLDLANLNSLAVTEAALLSELEALTRERAQLYSRENDAEDEMARLLNESESLEAQIIQVKRFGGFREIFAIDLNRSLPRLGRISGLRLTLRNNEEGWAEVSSALGQCCLLLKSLVSWQTSMVPHPIFPSLQSSS